MDHDNCPLTFSKALLNIIGGIKGAISNINYYYYSTIDDNDTFMISTSQPAVRWHMFEVIYRIFSRRVVEIDYLSLI